MKLAERPLKRHTIDTFRRYEKQCYLLCSSLSIAVNLKIKHTELLAMTCLYLSLMCESNPLKPLFCRILFIIPSFSLLIVSLRLSSSPERQLCDKICCGEFWHLHMHQRRSFFSKEWSREVVRQYINHPGVLGRLFLNGNDSCSTNVTAVRRGLQMRLMFCVFFFLPFFHSWFRFGSASHSNLLPSSQILPSLVEKSVPPFNGWIGVLLKLFFSQPCNSLPLDGSGRVHSSSNRLAKRSWELKNDRDDPHQRCETV